MSSSRSIRSRWSRGSRRCCAGRAGEGANGVLRVGPVEVDTTAHMVRTERGEVALTLTEFRLLAIWPARRAGVQPQRTARRLPARIGCPRPNGRQSCQQAAPQAGSGGRARYARRRSRCRIPAVVARMRNRNSLTRQLSIAMAALAFVAVAVSTAAFYIVYAVLERLRIVAPLPPGVADTTGLDVGITLAACVIGVVLALAVAVRLARRIVQPLGAVGEAARRIAEGDLTTRIAPVRAAHGEAALLIADFNAMATDCNACRTM